MSLRSILTSRLSPYGHLIRPVAFLLPPEQLTRYKDAHPPRPLRGVPSLPSFAELTLREHCCCPLVWLVAVGLSARMNEASHQFLKDLDKSRAERDRLPKAARRESTAMLFTRWTAAAEAQASPVQCKFNRRCRRWTQMKAAAVDRLTCVHFHRPVDIRSSAPVH